MKILLNLGRLLDQQEEDVSRIFKGIRKHNQRFFLILYETKDKLENVHPTSSRGHPFPCLPPLAEHSFP